MSLSAPIRTLAVLLLTLTLLPAASAAPPPLVRYQGRLTDNAGVPLNGLLTLQFEIYGAESGGSLLWSETRPGINVDNGNVDVALGAITPIAPTVFDGSSAWLQVTVGGTVLTPRQQLTSVPYVLGRQTLDDGYDAGGAGAGRTITADAGPVHIIDNAVGDTYELKVQNSHASGGAGIIIDRTLDARASQIQFSSTGSGEWHAGILRFGGSPTHRFAISSNSDLDVGGRELVIDNGNVGIGTANPQTPLHILKTGVSTSADVFRVSGATDAGNADSALNIKAIYEPGVGAAYDFQVGKWNGSGYTYMDALTLRPSGNVGIGTTSPATSLDVAGGGLRVSGGFGPLGVAANVGGLDHQGSGNFRVLSYGVDNASPGRIVFHQSSANNTVFRDAVVIDTDGQVGIGTVSPQYKLDIDGHLRIGMITNNNGNPLCEAGGVVQHCSSLRHLKEQIRDLDLPGLETVQRLRPVAFVWKLDGSADVGFIAEEVDVDTRLATFDEHGLVGVKYDHLTSVLVKAIQEQQRQIEELRSEVESLRAQVVPSR